MKNFFSIKWKMTIVYVALSSVVILFFAWTANQVFESDKIAYVFDSQQTQVTFLAKQFKTQIEQISFQSKLIASEYSLAQKELSASGEKILASQKIPLYIHVFDAQSKTVYSEIGDPKLAVTLPNDQRLPYTKELGALLLENKLIGIVQPAQIEGRWVQLYTFANLRDMLPAPESQALFALHLNGNFLLREDSNEGLRKALLEVQESSKAVQNSTSLNEISTGKYLVTKNSIGLGGLEVISIVSSDQALQALKLLMRKSALFVVFSILLVAFVSVLISAVLTRNLAILKAAAEKISAGDFTSERLVESKDEIGILSRTFEKMSKQIQKLLVETKDKERMEAELKTASLVQESLLPTQPEVKFGKYNIKGSSVSSSECGGDWWYYFKHDNYVYLAIADATGHGTPAALITAAARSIFSKLENSQIDLLTMMSDWNQAIQACSRNKVFMTGLLMRINKNNGHVEAYNASHEMPLLIKKNEDSSHEVSVVMLEPGQTLGELRGIPWQMSEFDILPGEKLVLYTDGQTAEQNAEGKSFGERRLYRSIAKISEASSDPNQMISGLENMISEYRGAVPLPDDVTLVVLEL